MPSARAPEFRRVAAKLGFKRVRTRGSHERWPHQDGRGVTIPVHDNRDISGPVFYQIIEKLGITIDEFRRLK